MYKRQSLKKKANVFEKLTAGGPVNGVEEDALLIEKQIRVVAHTSRNRVDILKQCQAIVVGADPEQIICNFSYEMCIRDRCYTAFCREEEKIERGSASPGEMCIRDSWA